MKQRNLFKFLSIYNRGNYGQKNISSPFVPKGFGNKLTPQQALIQVDSGAIHRGNLLLWNSNYFTDPVTWVAGNPFRFIVHCFAQSANILADSSLFLSGGKILSQWDNISASLISNEKSFTYGVMGVVLKVPYQNIVITHHCNLFFRNNIGDMKRRRYDIVNDRFNWADLQPWERNGALTREITKHHDMVGIHTPDMVLSQTYNERNELIIISRPGVNIHPGLPSTRAVEVTAVIFREQQKKLPHYWSQILDLVHSSSDKYKWPVLNIPGGADVEGW
jgi:hypothetical protein